MSGRAPRSRQVSEEIRAMILGGQLSPGERLVEDKLSAELGVSRVPVREALLALSAQGLVQIEPRRGATVAAVTPKIVAELVEVRALLEARYNVSFEDIRSVYLPALRHRVLLNFEAQAENVAPDTILSDILKGVSETV